MLGTVIFAIFCFTVFAVVMAVWNLGVLIFLGLRFGSSGVSSKTGYLG